MNKIIELAIQDGVEKYAMNPIKLVTKPIGAVARKLFGTTASKATMTARQAAPAAIQRIQAANPVAQQLSKTPLPSRPVATPKVDAEHAAKVTQAKANIGAETVATPKPGFLTPKNIALIGGGAAALGIGAKMFMGHVQQQAIKKMLPYGAAALVGGGVLGRMTAPNQPMIVQS